MFFHSPHVPFNTLLGLTLKKIQANDDQIFFFTTDGRQFVMEHDQDCCESVFIEDIDGALNDLLEYPILLAEESSSASGGDDFGPRSDWDESYTWTFYRLATVKGYANIRWYGTSNGYYSERVSFQEITNELEWRFS